MSFTRDAAVPAGGLEPVSNERLARLFDENGTSYGTSPDGELGGFWHDHLFTFWHAGKDSEFFQVRGRWTRGVPESELDRVLRLLNDWHVDKLWPKAYVEANDGEVYVFTEHTVDYADGATDAQVHLHVRTAIASSLALFEALDGQYAEHLAADKARLEDESSAGGA